MAGYAFVRIVDLIEAGWSGSDGGAHVKLANGIAVRATEDNAPGVVIEYWRGRSFEKTRCQTMAQVDDLVADLASR